MAHTILSCDVLVVGSGAAGLTAAVVSSSYGMDTLVVEKEALVGGTTGLSGGTIWIPNNPIAKACGYQDSEPRGRQYLNSALGEPNADHPESTTSRREAFLRNGPEMISYLRTKGFQWSLDVSKFPDYHPRLPGALQNGGRTLNPAIFDAAALKSWKDYLTIPTTSPQISKFEDLRVLTRPLASLRDIWSICWMAIKSAYIAFVCHSPVSMGSSLIAQLLNICRRQGNVRVRTETQLLELLIDEGKVIGGTLEADGTRLEVRARRGVFLASAGFARNQAMRNAHLANPTSTDWTLARTGGDTGEVLLAATLIGAKTSLLQETWGLPTMKDPLTGEITPAMFELSKPHSIAVNQKGQRFCSEAQPYGDFVHSMYEGKDANIPAWLILDQKYLRKYTLGSLQPWADPSPAVQSGRIYRAVSIPALAKKLQISADELERTVERWNVMCELGKDADFGRGDDAYQKFIGDANVKPNPCMGRIDSQPFYALKIFPGDAGTKGGLVTDGHGRVLDKGGDVIAGLYAAGNISASLFGRASLGAGVTIGPAMTFAFTAVQHMRQAL